MTGAAQGLVNYSLAALDWFFLLLCTFFVVFMAAIGFSRYGKIKLGADDEEPEFSTGSWIAMLFAAGMGSGLLFWGVAETDLSFRDSARRHGRWNIRSCETGVCDYEFSLGVSCLVNLWLLRAGHRLFHFPAWFAFDDLHTYFGGIQKCV